MPDDESPHYNTSSREQWDKLKPRAREMRHTPTPAEDRLWQAIRNRRLLDAKFRRQHAVEGFIADFVCIERWLIVELDGSVHESVDQQQYDAERQAILEARGFRVLRLTNEQVACCLPAVLEAIGAALSVSP